MVTVSRGEILHFEQAATGVLWSGGEYKVASYGATPGKNGVPDAPTILPNQVQYKFVEYPNGQRLLAVENGYNQALAYRARLHSGDHSDKTTVCMVAPHKRTIEHWPWAVDWIELREIHLVEWFPGDKLPCG